MTSTAQRETGADGGGYGLRRWGRTLGSTEIFCYCLLWLMVLTVVGSIAQKYIGLHDAQMRYFSSWILWASFIPLPGGRLTMVVVFANLTARLIFASPLRWRRSGVIISHLGALLLLVGGFITAYRSVEGYILIPEGEQRGYFEDHYAKELTVTRTAESGADLVTAYSGGFMKAGKELPLEGFGGTITIEELHENCEVIQRSGAAPPDARGMAATSELQVLPKAGEDESRAGAVLRVSGIGQEVDGLYLALERVPATRVRGAGGDELFRIGLQPRRYKLPFEILLEDFEMTKHPGTEMARDYRSHIKVLKGVSAQKADIWMNHPLRAEGYTFYQQSYIDGRHQATVLSVVRNAGRLFPYISSIIICIGMLIHLAILFVESSRRRRNAEEAA
jgi:hypothetical protein